MADQQNSADQAQSTTYDFQAEVSRLLHLMVHSVYTEKEIFLRELISNASDACDKLRYEAVKQSDLLSQDPELKIRLEVDEDNKQLHVIDNGIGMNKEELIENLGTIARSGTKAFLDKMQKDQEDGSLIGQFGVGFYSAFMVADDVSVVSRKAGEDAAFRWHSDGSGGFEIAELSAEDAQAMSRGTKVTLHLKEDAQDYLKENELARIVRAYSDHISFPILFINPKAEAEAAKDKSDDQGESEDASGPRQLNTGSALWTRSKSEISEEDYKGFYRDVAGQYDDPAHIIHYQAEGRQAYSVLLFLPSMRPFDLFDPDRKGRIKLYVRRVFITDDADLLPSYLRFVRGVIDSQDMPLNISREMLQNNPMVAAIRKAVTNRVLSELKKIAEKEDEKEQENFLKIWENFGAVLKEGLYEDMERRDNLFEIARFKTTKSEAGENKAWRSLKDYCADMQDNQTDIYYLTGESQDVLSASPQLEGYRARGVEVLLLSDPVDNFWVSNALGFDGKPFKSITQGDADLSNIEKQDDEGDKKSGDESPDEAALNAKLIEALKAELDEAVSDVRRSDRLVESPACLVAPAGGPDRGFEKIMARQAAQGGQMPGLKPVLEINLDHDFVRAAASRADDAGEEFKDLAWVLLEQARILEGEVPSDPAQFAKRMNRLILGKTS